MNNILGSISAKDLQSRGGGLPRTILAVHNAHSNGLVAECGKIDIADGPDASRLSEKFAAGKCLL
jgi:hypothetical protein